MALGLGDKDGDRAAADTLLAKLRAFVADQLTEEEAALFAALVAPGVARAYMDECVAPSGSDGRWCPRALPDSLVDAVRDHAIRVEGLT